MWAAPGSPHSKKYILLPSDRQTFSACASAESTVPCAVLKMLCKTASRLQAAPTRNCERSVVGKARLTGKHRSQPPAPEHVGRARFTPQQEVHTPAVRPSNIFSLRLSRKYRSVCRFENALQNSKPPSGGSDSQTCERIGCWKEPRLSPLCRTTPKLMQPRAGHPPGLSPQFKFLPEKAGT